MFPKNTVPYNMNLNSCQMFLIKFQEYFVKMYSCSRALRYYGNILLNLLVLKPHVLQTLN